MSRYSEINDRLAAIEAGLFVDFIQNTYNAQHEKKPLCVGLNWDFALQDISEAAEVIFHSFLEFFLEHFVYCVCSQLSSVSEVTLWQAL